MKMLLLFVALFAVCSPKTYSKVEIGMPFNDFHKLCNAVDAMASGDARTVTNSNSSTLTVTLNPTPYPLSNSQATPRPSECVGTFTFTDGTLTTISR